ncbi:MAG: Gfo/Idh/MocA family oxidoreductase [Abditibacteriales bacterium]|nr:Gfo/Idh/MocA family oxidoreductase [Abditibacteriales bacterium]MDW8364229.1 Gfo/Idh/MocA family oxidoreductase [Abditibacteriales bacterium]
MLHWAILSCGDIVNKRVAPALAAQPQSRLVGFYSTSRERARGFAERFGAEKFTDRLEECLSWDVQAVYVASPVHRHCAETVAAAEAGKHVLCEKPMALNVVECKRMIAACKANGVHLAIAYYRRWYPKARKMKALLDAGAIGQVIRGHILLTGYYDPQPDDPKHWRVIPEQGGGGAMMDVGSHRLDVMCYLLGKPQSVCGFASRLKMSYEVPDTETFLIQFENGAHVTCSTNWNLRTGRDDFEIYGTEGALIASPFDGDTLTLLRGREREEFHLPKAENTHYPLIDSFTQRLLAGKPPEFTGEDGLLTAQIISGGYESARTGTTTRIT